MKRIKAACLEQTVHFQLKDDLGHAAAARAVKEEYEHYKICLLYTSPSPRDCSESRIPSYA